MFKIGDFSQLGRVSVRTLRHYDELGLLKPAQTDRFTDYRYYAIEQLPTLNRILALKELGLSLDQIAGLLRDDVPVTMLRSMLTTKQTEIEQEIEEGRARLSRVEMRLQQIEQEGKLSPYEVTLKSAEPQTIVSARRVVPTIPDMATYRCALYDEIYGWLMERRVRAGEPELAIYHNQEFFDREIDMEAGVVVDAALLRGVAQPDNGRITVSTLPSVETMASVLHSGSFYEVGQAITALFAWVGTHGYATCGPYREIHLFGRENDLVSVDEVVVEMQVPVERAAF